MSEPNPQHWHAHALERGRALGLTDKQTRALIVSDERMKDASSADKVFAEHAKIVVLCKLGKQPQLAYGFMQKRTDPRTILLNMRSTAKG